MIAYHTWYKVGSKDEAEGVTGAAHMLEHIMFKGAEKYSNKDFDRIFHENGIQNNAFTTYDYTGFYENLPSSRLELVMDMEVDRMKSLKIDPKDVLSEREVVKEERRWRVDNNPMGLLRELTMATVFKVHPYKWPVIGHMKDIAEYQAPTLRKFYDQYYGPNNAVLVLAGDFKTSQAQTLIEKYYGPLATKPVPARPAVREPVQTSQNNARLRKEVQNTSFNVSFQGVSQGHPDMYALDLASSILGGGPSSRLYKRLVYQKQIATSAYAYHMSLQDHGVFSVGVNVKPGLGEQEALDIVYNEIYKLRNKPVSDEELRRAKNLVIKSSVDGMATMDGKARALAAAEIVTGDYKTIFSDLEKYEAVTAQDIQKIADRMLNQAQRSIITLEPKVAAAPAAPAAPATPAGDAKGDQ